MIGTMILLVQFNGAPSVNVVEVDVDDSIVEIDLDGMIQSRRESPRDRFYSDLFGGPRSYQLDDLRKTLARAGEDIRVRGVYLNLRNPVGGFAIFKELRQSLVEFQKTGKPLYVNLYSGETLSYFLASAGSKINLSPLGGLSIPGPAFQLTYFGPALEKLGVEMEVFRAGKYKSAMEPFVNKEPSDASREMYEAMEQSLRASLASTIGEQRKKEQSEVLSWLKKSFLSSDEALSLGAIDRVGYEDGFRVELEELTKTTRFVKWRRYLSASQDLDEPRIAQDDASVGYVEAFGEIRMTQTDSSSPSIVPDHLIRELKWQAEQEDVKAVVMRVDSPGGSALAADMIWEEVRKLSLSKPVVVSMGQVAASGGYYISAPAQKILADPQTITGSIGVIGAKLVGKDVADRYGVHFHVISQSDRRDFLNFSRSASEDDKKIMSQSIDHVYQTFIRKVADGRGKSKDQIHELAQGRVYTGMQALELGLVDQLGGRQEAFRLAKELAKLNPEKLYKIKRYRRKPTSILDCLDHGANSWECINDIEVNIGFRSALQNAIPEPLQSSYRTLSLLQEESSLVLWPASVKW